MKIFILEDDPERIRWLRETLIDHETTFIISCIGVDNFQPPYDLILLDHDLGGRQLKEHEDCGLTFVNLVKDRINPEAVIIIHSFNPDGAQRMQQALFDAGIKNVDRCPFRGRAFEVAVSGATSRTRTMR